MSETITNPGSEEKPKFKKTLMVHMTEELYNDLELIKFWYRTSSVSNAVRNLFEDKIKEIKKEHLKLQNDSQMQLDLQSKE